MKHNKVGVKMELNCNTIQNAVVGCFALEVRNLFSRDSESDHSVKTPGQVHRNSVPSFELFYFICKQAIQFCDNVWNKTPWFTFSPIHFSRRGGILAGNGGRRFSMIKTSFLNQR